MPVVCTSSCRWCVCVCVCGGGGGGGCGCGCLFVSYIVNMEERKQTAMYTLTFIPHYDVLE